MASTRRSGYTLVELAISMALATIATGSLFTLSTNLLAAFRSGSAVATLQSQGGQTLQQVNKLLRNARRENLSMGVGEWGGTLQFQRAQGFGGGVALWGDWQRVAVVDSLGDPDDGVDNDGDGLIDEKRLVWIERPGAANPSVHLLLDGVSESLEGEVPDNGVDDNGNGITDEPGFLVQRTTEGLLEIELTLAREVAHGQVLSRTARKAIRLDN